MRHSFLLIACLILSACATYDYPSQVKIGDPLISFNGQSLEEQPVKFPDDIAGKSTLLIFGFVQDSQFDIDRWLIGLDMTKTDINIIEVPAVKGWYAKFIGSFIDNGMRSGIPKELWRVVVTVYEDGTLVQEYMGNERPRNARIVLVDKNGIIQHFYDRGFSVNALNELRDAIASAQ